MNRSGAAGGSTFTSTSYDSRMRFGQAACVVAAALVVEHRDRFGAAFAVAEADLEGVGRLVVGSGSACSAGSRLRSTHSSSRTHDLVPAAVDARCRVRCRRSGRGSPALRAASPSARTPHPTRASDWWWWRSLSTKYVCSSVKSRSSKSLPVKKLLRVNGPIVARSAELGIVAVGGGRHDVAPSVQDRSGSDAGWYRPLDSASPSRRTPDRAAFHRASRRRRARARRPHRVRSSIGSRCGSALRRIRCSLRCARAARARSGARGRAAARASCPPRRGRRPRSGARTRGTGRATGLGWP